ncbi:MAG: DUF948 domain-containing protein [Coleofasciculaceae cyanobacterium]
MIDPLFFLGLSILLVAVSLTAVLIAALPAFLELRRAARSIEKLADTLRRELPPTLEAIRLTGLEISELTDEVGEGVKSAGQVVKQVDQSVSSTKNQAKKLQSNTRRVAAGFKAAWKTWKRGSAKRGTRESLTQKTRASLEPSLTQTAALRAKSSLADNAYQDQETDYEEADFTNGSVPYQEFIPGNSRPPKQYEDWQGEDEDRER